MWLQGKRPNVNQIMAEITKLMSEKKCELAPYKKTSKEILGPTSKECKDLLTAKLNYLECKNIIMSTLISINY